jgi:hypothetical protein
MMFLEPSLPWLVLWRFQDSGSLLGRFSDYSASFQSHLSPAEHKGDQIRKLLLSSEVAKVNLLLLDVTGKVDG